MKFVASYYKVRNICHLVKEFDTKAIKYSVNLLSRFIDASDIVVPMPSHFGQATYMLAIAEGLKEKCGCEVMNILSSNAHEPWYNTKLQNGINSDLNYEFNVDDNNQIHGKIYIIDNVYSSGKTMNAAINKIKEFYPNCDVEGLVIGYVDQETIEKLNYGEELHEEIIKPLDTNNKYVKYCLDNSSEFLKLMVKFLQNTNEGAKLYEPYIRCSGTTPDGKNYLRFERSYDHDKRGNYKILTQCNKQLIDFNYLSQLLKLFMFFSDKYSASFEYNKNGQLEYVIKLIDNIKRKENGEQIISNGHPISKQGKHVYRYGKIKSPTGFYTPHNHNNLSTTKSKFGNKWNKYFNPEYYVYNAQGQVTGFERSNQTGNGQFPLHWFPKTGDDSHVDLFLLAKMIVSAFKQHGNKHSEALFIAFLKCVDTGKINGYEMIQQKRINDIIRICEQEIKGVKPQKTQAYNYKKPEKYYQSQDSDRFFDSDGHSRDEDMEWQINHLNVESIVKDVLKKILF